MSFDYINEAFRKLNSLTEDTFDTSITGINALAEFRDQDDETDIIKVIDPDANDDSQLSDSYVGKVIINCNVCHSLVFENKEDVVLDEDGVVNPEMQCPYCGETSGFTVVGEIQPFDKDTEDKSDDTADDDVKETAEDESEDKKETEPDAASELQESLQEDGMNNFRLLKSFMSSNGFNIPSKDVDPRGNEAATSYLWSVVDLFDNGDIQITDESLAQWLHDTKQNYPEDLLLFTESATEGLLSIPTPPVPFSESSLTEFMDINLDARGLGGEGNNVSVLSGKSPFKNESLTRRHRRVTESAVKRSRNPFDDQPGKVAPTFTPDQRDRLGLDPLRDDESARFNPFDPASEKPSARRAYAPNSGRTARVLTSSSMIDEDRNECIEEGIFDKKKDKQDVYTVSYKQGNKWMPLKTFNNKSDAVAHRDECQENSPDTQYLVHSGRKFESLGEGIFDKKKNSAEYKNQRMDFDSEVEHIAKGSLDDIASALSSLLNDSISAFRNAYNRDKEIDKSSKTRVFEAKAAQVLSLYAEMIKAFKKPSNLTQAVSYIERATNKILGDYSGTSDRIANELSRYRTVLTEVEGIKADTKVKQDARTSFFNALSRNLTGDLQFMKKQPEHTLFEGIFDKFKKNKDTKMYDVWCSLNGKTWKAYDNISAKEADECVKDAYDSTGNAEGYKAWKEPHVDGDKPQGKKITESLEDVKNIKSYLQSMICKQYNPLGLEGPAMFATWLSEDSNFDSDKIAEVAFLMGYDVYKTNYGYFSGEDYLIVYPGVSPDVYIKEFDDGDTSWWEETKSSLVKLESLNESIEDLSMTANDTHLEITEDDAGKVTVTMGPVTSDGEETIAPVSDETMAEIESNNSEETEETDETEETEESADGTEEVDVDIEAVDEEGMDELGESYLRETYQNVESFKTTAVSTTDTSMIVEGIVTFTSGVQKNTGFVFEARTANSSGKIRFTGMNKHLSESSNAFTLTGTVAGKKFLPESLSYNYSVGAKQVNGTVTTK